MACQSCTSGWDLLRLRVSRAVSIGQPSGGDNLQSYRHIIDGCDQNKNLNWDSCIIVGRVTSAVSHCPILWTSLEHTFLSHSSILLVTSLCTNELQHAVVASCDHCGQRCSDIVRVFLLTRKPGTKRRVLIGPSQYELDIDGLLSDYLFSVRRKGLGRMKCHSCPTRNCPFSVQRLDLPSPILL